MFDRLKKALGLPSPSQAEADASASGHSSQMSSRLSQWASLQGYSVEENETGLLANAGPTFKLTGRVGQKPWRVESGRPSRWFIKGHELRARAQLDLPPDLAVMVLGRGLKEQLEKKAFAAYTNSLQTEQGDGLGEEMRWLTLYEELRQSKWDPAFASQMAVLSSDPPNAARWLDATLMRDLLHWPSDMVSPETPLVLQLRRGNLYLRMQYNEGDIPTLEHAVRIVVWASESALNAFSGSD